MDKLTEALKALLPEENVSEVAKAVESMMAEQAQQIEAGIEAKYQKQLTETYERVSNELKETEETALRGYQQAYEIIADLQNRIDVQREALENAMEKGFEEAFQMLKAEEAKNENLEVELYEEFNNKLKQMKGFMVEKLDKFMGEQEAELYAEAKKNILSDPRIVEQKVAVERMAEILSDYLGGDSYNSVNSRKVEEALKAVEDLKGQLRVVESRNVRLSMQNTKLNEQVREAHNLITEATKVERKERVVKKQNASGRGQRVTEQIITEHVDAPVARNNQHLNESVNDDFNDLLVLSGVIEQA